MKILSFFFAIFLMQSCGKESTPISKEVPFPKAFTFTDVEVTDWKLFVVQSNQSVKSNNWTGTFKNYEAVSESEIKITGEVYEFKKINFINDHEAVVTIEIDWNTHESYDTTLTYTQTDEVVSLQYPGISGFVLTYIYDAAQKRLLNPWQCSFHSFQSAGSTDYSFFELEVANWPFDANEVAMKVKSDKNLMANDSIAVNQYNYVFK